MDTPTSAAPDEKTPPPELALATQLSKREVVSLWSAGNQRRDSSSVARLTSNSIDELHKWFPNSKNATIPEIRGRQRAASDRERGGRN